MLEPRHGVLVTGRDRDDAGHRGARVVELVMQERLVASKAALVRADAAAGLGGHDLRGEICPLAGQHAPVDPVDPLELDSGVATQRPRRRTRYDGHASKKRNV